MRRRHSGSPKPLHFLRKLSTRDEAIAEAERARLHTPHPEQWEVVAHSRGFLTRVHHEGSTTERLPPWTWELRSLGMDSPVTLRLKEQGGNYPFNVWVCECLGHKAEGDTQLEALWATLASVCNEEIENSQHSRYPLFRTAALVAASLIASLGLLAFLLG